MKILVVEDDRSVRETLGLVLESYGHLVELVDGADGALGYLAREWPDAMLLDLTLENITGEELYDQIIARFRRVPPTVVISAVMQGERRARTLPGVLFLAKPYSLDQLMDTVQRAVNQGSVLGLERALPDYKRMAGLK